MIERTVRIIRDYFEEEIKVIQPKNVPAIDELLSRNVTKLLTQRAWNEMKVVYPELEEKHQEFIAQLEDKVVVEFVSTIEKL